MSKNYDPNRAEAASKLLELLDGFEGESADAQLLIERAMREREDDALMALAKLTDNEGNDGFRIVLEYDNTHDGARVLNADGAAIGECYDMRKGPDRQFLAAIRKAIAAPSNT